MIPWIKYDPENPPQDGIEYLVTDGHRAGVAYLYNFEIINWFIPDALPIDKSEDVTHYAHINLPGEETDNA